MLLDTSSCDSLLESHVGRMGVLESTAKSSKVSGDNVVIAVIECKDIFYEELWPCNVFCTEFVVLFLILTYFTI